MAATKTQKTNKQIAEMVLRVQGLDYDAWLDEQHTALISKSTDVIAKVTQLALAKDLPSHSNASSNEEGGN